MRKIKIIFIALLLSINFCDEFSSQLKSRQTLVNVSNHRWRPDMENRIKNHRIEGKTREKKNFNFWWFWKGLHWNIYCSQSKWSGRWPTCFNGFFLFRWHFHIFIPVSLMGLSLVTSYIAYTFWLYFNRFSILFGKGGCIQIAPEYEINFHDRFFSIRTNR